MEKKGKLVKLLNKMKGLNFKYGYVNALARKIQKYEKQNK